MIKLLLISHALAQEASQKRWRLLAETGRFDIRILVPEIWVSQWFQTREPIVFHARAIQRQHFEVCPVPTTSDRQWGKYVITNLHQHMKEFSPDVIFCIHEEHIRQLQHTIVYKRFLAPDAKLLYFSMHAFQRIPPLKRVTAKNILKNLYFRLIWWNVLRGTDGALVHCPLIRNQMQKENYRKPILLQTQIGVDRDIFTPNSRVRETIRRDLKLNGFVVGYAGRLVEKKGVIDLITALQSIETDWQLLLVGDGEARRNIENWAKRHDWSHRVKITGAVPLNDVAKYMNAMDCFFIGSHTTGNWIDTFPLVVAQAMATGLPVVGSDSGAIPYQLGGKGLIFPEGDTAMLQHHLSTLAKDVSLRSRMGACLLQRAQAEFCITAMNEQFDAFIQQHILNREF